MQQMLAPVIQLPTTAAPFDPAANIAALSLESGVTPALIRPWAARLAAEPRFRLGGCEAEIVAAYFRLRAS